MNVSNFVKDEDELRLFSPLGCGFQSGMGTVDQLTGATEKDKIVIMGLGAVGLTAIMVFSSLDRCNIFWLISRGC